MNFLVMAVEVDILTTPIVGFVAKDAFAEMWRLSPFLYFLLFARHFVFHFVNIFHVDLHFHLPGI